MYSFEEFSLTFVADGRTNKMKTILLLKMRRHYNSNIAAPKEYGGKDISPIR